MADIADEHYRSYNVNKANIAIFDHLRWANRVFHNNEPWKLVKIKEKKDHVDCVLHVAMETLRVCSILLQPVAPQFSDKILNKLNIPVDCRTVKHAKRKLEIPFTDGHELDKGPVNIMRRLQH